MGTDITIEGGVSLHNESGTTAMPDSGFPRDEPLTLEVLYRQSEVLRAIIEENKAQAYRDQLRTDRRLDILEEHHRHLEETTASKIDAMTQSFGEGRAEVRMMQTQISQVVIESSSTARTALELKASHSQFAEGLTESRKTAATVEQIKTILETRERMEDRTRQANRAYVPQVIVAIVTLLGTLGGVWLGHIWK